MASPTPSEKAKVELQENLVNILNGGDFPRLYELGRLAIAANTAYPVMTILANAIQVAFIPELPVIFRQTEDYYSTNKHLERFFMLYDSARSKALHINTIFSFVAAYGTSQVAYETIMAKYMDLMLNIDQYFARILLSLKRIRTNRTTTNTTDSKLLKKYVLYLNTKEYVQVWDCCPSDIRIREEIDKMIKLGDKLATQFEMAYMIPYKCPLNVTHVNSDISGMKFVCAYDNPWGGLLHSLLRHRLQLNNHVSGEYRNLSAFCLSLIDYIGAFNDPDERYLFHDIAKYFSSELAGFDKHILHHMQKNFHGFLIREMTTKPNILDCEKDGKRILEYQCLPDQILRVVFGKDDMNLITAFLVQL